MAEATLQTARDFTCSICVDLFREPVTLPCNHSYCRECLQMFWDRSGLSKTNPPDTINKRKTIAPLKPGKPQVTCPLCKSVYILTITNMGDFPGNKALAEAVASHRAKEAVKEGQKMCSMCEDGQQKDAVMVVPPVISSTVRNA